MKRLTIGAVPLPMGPTPTTTVNRPLTFDGSERPIDPRITAGGGAGGETPPIIGRPTSIYTTPTRYADAFEAQPGSIDPYMPPKPLPPSSPPAPETPPTLPVTCPDGYVFNPGTNQCIPVMAVDTQGPTAPTGQQAPQSPTTYPVPQAPTAPDQVVIMGRAIPKKWLWIAAGSVGFGLLLLAIIAASRRRRRVAA